MTRRIQRWPLWFLGAWFVLSSVYLKVYLHARAEFRQAETRLRNGKVRAAVRRYGRAIRWYTPGNRYVKASVVRLSRIGELAFRRGDWEQATITFQHLCGALSSLKGIYQPYLSTLKTCRKHLSTVLSQLPPPGIQKGMTQDIRQKEILAVLQGSDAPSTIGSVLSLLGYILWLWCCGRLCWRWSMWSSTKRWVWGVVGVAGFVLWLLGLTIA
jgi:hypothetical protein